MILSSSFLVKLLSSPFLTTRFFNTLFHLNLTDSVVRPIRRREEMERRRGENRRDRVEVIAKYRGVTTHQVSYGRFEPTGSREEIGQQ
jgi:hypothetical protein